MVKDIAQEKQEGLSHLEYHFPTGRCRKHDPKGLVLQHQSQVSSCWPYDHDSFEDDIFTKGTQDWEEVLHRIANPSITKFKVMTMDEQVDTIENTTQEVLRVRDKNKVVETTKA
jgi:hypothetical protein